MKLTTRQLIVAVLYACAALCALIGLLYAGGTGALTGTDLALTTVGVAAWGTAAGQGLYRRSRAKKIERDLESGIALPADNKQVMLPSTHGKINSVLHVVSSSCFLFSDAVKLANPTLVLAARSSGSFLWLKSAVLSYFLAQAQAEKEKNQTSDVKSCGVKPTSLNLLIEAEYFASAILYALAIYADTTLNPFKVPGNICWLLSAMHDTSTAVYTQATASTENKPIAPRIVFPITLYNTVPARSRSAATVEVIDEKADVQNSKLSFAAGK
jgi:hypothetical protein